MDTMEHLYIYIIVLLGSVHIVESACIDEPDVPNAALVPSRSGSFSNGTVLKFTCNNGYSESGSSPSYTCRENSWVGGDLECTLIFCNQIDPPENGRITNCPNFAAGSSVSFSCNKGYERNGASTLTCRTDGQWRPLSPPTCDVKMCPDFGSVTNANIFQEATDGVKNHYGSMVKITCDRNYVLVGKNLVKCLETGQWEDKPTCEPVTCPPLAGATSSCINSTTFYPSGKLFVLKCFDESFTRSVTRIGAPMMDTACKNNKWSQPEPACYCDCLMNTSLSYVSMNNLVKSKFLKHGNTLDWSCSRGATMATSEAVVCTDGRLSAEPECTPPVTTTTRATTTTSSPPENEHAWNNFEFIMGILVGVVAVVAIVLLIVFKRCPVHLEIFRSMWGGCLRGSCCRNSQKPTILGVVTIPAGETLTLECPRESPTGPVVWEGPPEYTRYSENDDVNPYLPWEVRSRVSTNRTHDLQIQHGGKTETVDVKVKPADMTSHLDDSFSDNDSMRTEGLLDDTAEYVYSPHRREAFGRKSADPLLPKVTQGTAVALKPLEKTKKVLPPRCTDNQQSPHFQVNTSVQESPSQETYVEYMSKPKKGTKLWEPGSPEYMLYTTNRDINPKLPQEVRSRVSVDEVFTLQIQNVTQTDSGHYRCSTSAYAKRNALETEVKVCTPGPNKRTS